MFKNWSPISLINCDAKLFTKVLSHRLPLKSIITPFQTGFMRNRLIADNGLLVRLAMSNSQATQHPGIALLLDPEKAYDRVHSIYLRRTLFKFGFPLALLA